MTDWLPASRIGQSEPLTDWHYSHMPQATSAGGEITPFRGVAGQGGAATRDIRFDLDFVRGDAILTVAINGSGELPLLELDVNGSPQGVMDFGRDDGSMKRHQINGVWRLEEAVIPAASLQQGLNTLSLTVPAGSLNRGVIYDAIRLEWNATDHSTRILKA